jgi:arylsulfatase A-like enzyme
MRPNVLLIMTDQQRFDSLGCYGSAAVSTPSLDRLAAQGARFTNCYANNPICTPSRASIFTGKPIVGHGVYRLHDDLPRSEVPFPFRLREAGYRTALFGKLHLSSRVLEQEHRHRYDGFDVYEEAKAPYLPPSRLNAYLPWLESRHPAVYAELQEKKRTFGHFPEEAHQSRWVSSRAIDFLSAHDRTRPFFCYASFFDPHDPYNDYPKSAESRVDTTRLASPVPEPDDWTRMPHGLRREHEHGYLGACAEFDAEQIRRMRIGYLASVAFIDNEVGRILAALDRLGYADDTLVIFTSDHGDMLGDHGLLAKGAFFYEPCVKVPLIVRYPGTVDGGTVDERIVQGSDLAATILSAAGVPTATLSATMPDSHDLLAGVAEGRPGEDDRAAICLYRGSGICDTQRYFDPPINAGMYRLGAYKLNLYFSDETPPAGQLFDVASDPNELHDLWDDPGHSTLRGELARRFTSELAAMDMQYNASRGGAHFPPPAQWSQNNPL